MYPIVQVHVIFLCNCPREPTTAHYKRNFVLNTCCVAWSAGKKSLLLVLCERGLIRKSVVLTLGLAGLYIIALIIFLATFSQRALIGII